MRSGNTEPFADLFQRAGCGAYPADLLRREFGRSVPPALKARAPAFTLAVGHVVLIGPKKQVLYIHAGGCIAAMAHKQPFRDFTSRDYPREPMRLSRFALPIKSAVLIRPSPAPKRATSFVRRQRHPRHALGQRPFAIYALSFQVGYGRHSHNLPRAINARK